MRTREITKRFIALLCVFALVGASLSPAIASMVGTDQMIAAEQAQVDRERLLETLSRDDVRNQLTAMGVDPAQAEARVMRMTDAEVAALNERLDELPAGGNALLGALLIIFIVFVITDAIGATDIFPFIRPVN
ncbi:hypothetical protein B1C78_09345 [Thioalkalivibrio denitrificans]|uniref:PA2779 family protein n=1 Tax=Thioalkalivibrio denitrificans TaxID=108003 RepID=A0A1V3NGB4_9GAMM|nr:DUF6627 family protein [Thioalkalivibrio denitrificans]OOG24121.1 hypothetical protein B1C78_09345 [Thioalkalivibrio denitrificans]